MRLQNDSDSMKIWKPTAPFFWRKCIIYVSTWSDPVSSRKGPVSKLSWSANPIVNAIFQKWDSGIISTERFFEFEKKKTGNEENSSSGTNWTYEKSLQPFYTSENVPRNLSMTPRYLGPLSPWEHFFEWNPNRKIEPRFWSRSGSVVDNIRIRGTNFEMSISSRNFYHGFRYYPLQS